MSFVHAFVAFNFRAVAVFQTNVQGFLNTGQVWRMCVLRCVPTTGLFEVKRGKKKVGEG